MSNSNAIRRPTIPDIPDPAAIQAWLEQTTREAEEQLAADKARVEALAASTRSQFRTRFQTIAGVTQPEETQDLIREVCDSLRDFLVEKNEQYGDSAINPVRIFSKASPVEQLLVRIDDKLSRIAHGDDRLESDDDVLDDLIGYLIMLKVAKRRDARADS